MNFQYEKINTTYIFSDVGSIRVDSVFQAVKLPTGSSNLDSSLSNVDGDNFTNLNSSDNEDRDVKQPTISPAQWRDRTNTDGLSEDLLFSIRPQRIWRAFAMERYKDQLTSRIFTTRWQ